MWDLGLTKWHMLSLIFILCHDTFWYGIVNKYTNSFNSYNSIFKTNIHILACTCNSIKNITQKHLKVNRDHKNSNKIHQTHDYKIKRTSPGFDEFTLKNSTAVHSRSENGFKKIMCVYKLTKTLGWQNILVLIYQYILIIFQRHFN